MAERSPVSDMAIEPSHKGKDAPTRAILISLVVLWVILFVGLLIFAWNAYFQQKDTAQTLAQQIAIACKSGDFGPGISETNERAICSNAKQVIESDKPLQGLQGPPGRDGRDGTDGTDGTDGAIGPPGKNGRNGKNGIDGTNGLNGTNGKDGLDGKDGTNGTDGKDGPPGPPGVVQVTTIGCEGPVIHQIRASYDPESQTVTIICN